MFTHGRVGGGSSPAGEVCGIYISEKSMALALAVCRAPRSLAPVWRGDGGVGGVDGHGGCCLGDRSRCAPPCHDSLAPARDRPRHALFGRPWAVLAAICRAGRVAGLLFGGWRAAFGRSQPGHTGSSFAFAFSSRQKSPISSPLRAASLSRLRHPCVAGDWA